jgi:septum formation protein
MHGETFILASASPRRRQLLRDAGYSFLVRPSRVEEPDPAGFASPEACAVHTAWLKAADVAASLAAEADEGASGEGPGGRPGPRTVVLAADTVVAAGGRILGKARDRAHADEILRSLMGTRHCVVTGLAVAIPRRGWTLCAHDASWVTMRRLSDADLERYLDSGEWRGKAGAYGIQDESDPFVSHCEGSFSNVVGLPMECVAELLPTAFRLAAEPPEP